MARLQAGTPLSPDVIGALVNAENTGGAIRLTHQLDRADYEQANAVLERIAGGGTWNRRAREHRFPPGRDPMPELNAVLEAGVLPPDPKRQAGWFATPKELADDLAYNHALMGLEPPGGGFHTDLRILEPSAGEGALADALCRWYHISPQQITCVEAEPYRTAILRHKGYPTFERRFQDWALEPSAGFDLVLMNPPFTEPGDRQAWIAHVELAWQLVVPGGRLVAVVPNSLTTRTDRRTTGLRVLVDRYGQVDDLAEAAFAESGTGVRCLVVQLDRPLWLPRPSATTPGAEIPAGSQQVSLFEEGA